MLSAQLIVLGIITLISVYCADRIYQLHSRKRQALSGSKIEQHINLFSLSSDSILIVDDKGSVVAANDRAGLLFDKHIDNIVGHGLDELINTQGTLTSLIDSLGQYRARQSQCQNIQSVLRFSNFQAEQSVDVPLNLAARVIQIDHTHLLELFISEPTPITQVANNQADVQKDNGIFNRLPNPSFIFDDDLKIHFCNITGQQFLLDRWSCFPSDNYKNYTFDKLRPDLAENDLDNFVAEKSLEQIKSLISDPANKLPCLLDIEFVDKLEHGIRVNVDWYDAQHNQFLISVHENNDSNNGSLVNNFDSSLVTICKMLPAVVRIASTRFENILYVNPAYEEVWGLSKESYYENPYSFMAAVHPEDLDYVSKNLVHLKSGHWDLNYRIYDADKQIRFIHDTGKTIRDENGKALYIVGVANDVTLDNLIQKNHIGSVNQIIHANDQFEKLVGLDGLTQCVNHNVFKDYAFEEINRFKRYRSPCSLLYINLDNFRSINLRYGRAAGDEAIVSFTTEIMRKIRSTDTLARHEGDKFFVLLRETSAVNASIVARKLTEQDYIVSFESFSFSIKANFALCEISEDIETVQQWIDTVEALGSDTTPI